MRLINAGSFKMGSPVSEAERSYHEQQHIVLLTRDFWITQTEVTIAQWEQVMGTTTVDICQGDELPSAATSKHEPMRCVSWCDAALFLNRLSEQNGYQPVYSFSAKLELSTDTNRWQSRSCLYCVESHCQRLSVSY